MNVKKLVLTALFIALSFVGANIKILGTIAFDSMPGYLGALILGPVYGAAIGFFGHMFTSLLSGFPYGLLLHGIIAVSMAVTMFCFALTFNFFKDKIAVYINYGIIAAVGTVLNGPGTLALCSPFLGVPVALSMLPVLTLVSFLNILLSIFVYISVSRALSKSA